MITVPYIFSHKQIAEGVKQESSLHAIRKRTEEGDNLFEEFVMDEEYNRKFRELFYDAQAMVVDRFSPYMQYETEDDFMVYDELDYSANSDFTFTLLMPADYNKLYNKQVSIKVREFLIAQIMYRWLETKLPEEAMLYKLRAERTLIDARAYLEKRIAVRRRTGGNFY